jgi:hypothetical protein
MFTGTPGLGGRSFWILDTRGIDCQTLKTALDRFKLDPKQGITGSEMEGTVEAPMSEREQAPVDATPQCELAECTCPDFCERDHDLD